MAVWKIAEPFKLNRTVQNKLKVVQGELFNNSLKSYCETVEYL